MDDILFTSIKFERNETSLLEPDMSPDLYLHTFRLMQHLVAHCEAWVTKLQALLQQMVTKQLLELHDTLESYIERWNSSTDEDDKMVCYFLLHVCSTPLQS